MVTASKLLCVQLRNADGWRDVSRLESKMKFLQSKEINKKGCSLQSGCWASYESRNAMKLRVESFEKGRK